MKKILIASHWMEIGGAERSLLGLLDSIDYSQYSVDLFLCRHSGELMKYIPKQVRLLEEDKKAKDIAIPIKEVIKHKNYDIALGRLISKVSTKIYNLLNKNIGVSTIEIEYSNKYTYRFIKDINQNEEYDLAISFLEPHYIVANKVRAKRKIAWMHTDYSAINVDIKEGYKIWDKYDNIVAISEECKNSFISKFPNLENKIIEIENIIPANLIIEQAIEKQVDNEIIREDNETILLSIGRFCEAKNFDNIPSISRNLADIGIKFKWYIIGFGGDEGLIRSKIAENNMESNVIILGKKENPYPYLKACDIYVQPSRYEGKSISVREAQILNKPVIITNFKTAKSQLIDGVDGIIVPINNEMCAKAIGSLINNKRLQQELSKNTRNREYINSSNIKKIYELIV